MLRLAVCGAGGRMGQALVRLASQAHDLVLVGVTSRGGSVPAGLPPGTHVQPDLAALLTAAPVDVVVDFTLPEATAHHADACAERGVAYVCGTTGLPPEVRARVDAASRRVPVVLSPNMSVGVNVLLGAAALLARTLGEGFDVEVLESHHRLKRDAPSGTALRLADVLLEALGRSREDLVLSREGNTGARPPRAVGVQTLRGGDVVGEHTVYFLGEAERVELTHRATSRDVFAAGALRAARWVAGRPPGLYDMPHVLGLEEVP
jgi:4-hydroxy-tetrahydrodipicolinate reductase